MKLGIGNHVYLILLNCQYQKYQKLLQPLKNKLIFPWTHLSLKKYILMELPLMLYLLIPQYSIEILNSELRI